MGLVGWAFFFEGREKDLSNPESWTSESELSPPSFSCFSYPRCVPGDKRCARHGAGINDEIVHK